jgi:hypoxanthine phosphoribosyltransferase
VKPTLSELPVPAGVPPDVARAFASAEELFTPDQVERAVNQLAVRVTLALQDANPVLIGVLHGGLVFLGLLMQRLVFPLQQGYVDVGRYGDGQTGGAITWHAQRCPPLTDRTVLLVDDVLDRGETLAALIDWAQQAGATRVLSAVLVEKPRALRTRQITADYAALNAPDRYLIGCGMDLAGYGRNLPAVYALAAQNSIAE